MMKFLRKYQYHIFLFTTIVFLLGTFVGFGGYFFTPKGGPNDSIAEVDGTKIPLRLFNSRYERALNNIKPGTTLDDNARKQIREESLRDLVQSVVFDEQAKHYGIVVPDEQVVNSLAQVPAFQDKGHFSPDLYGRALAYQLKTTPQDFEEEQRTSIAFFKLRWLIQSCVKVTDKEADMARSFAIATKSPDAKKDPAAFRDQLWQQKMLFCFNQWFTQIGQRVHVKTHLDILEGGMK